MQLGIFEQTANLVCRAAKLNSGYYPAEELQAVVAAWPDPDVALGLMQVDAESLPVVFAEVPFQFVGTWLLGLIREGVGNWPIVWMPIDRLGDWQEDVEAQTLRGYLQANRMGLGFQAGAEAHVRGWHVRLMDFRLMPLDGYHYDAAML